MTDTTASVPTADRQPPSADPGPSGGLLRTGAVAGAVAAIATTATAAIASAAGASLEVEGAAIPLGAFAWWSLIGAALGTGLARLLGRRRRFVIVTIAATALSLVPPIAAPDDLATRLVLVATHLIAAAIVIPALARRLPEA